MQADRRPAASPAMAPARRPPSPDRAMRDLRASSAIFRHRACGAARAGDRNPASPLSTMPPADPLAGPGDDRRPLAAIKTFLRKPLAGVGAEGCPKPVATGTALNRRSAPGAAASAVAAARKRSIPRGLSKAPREALFAISMYFLAVEKLTVVSSSTRIRNCPCGASVCGGRRRLRRP